MGQPVHGRCRPSDRLGIPVRRHAGGRAVFGRQLHLRHCGRSYRGKGWPATDTLQTLGTRFRRGALCHLPEPHPHRRAGLRSLCLHLENLDLLFRRRCPGTGVWSDRGLRSRHRQHLPWPCIQLSPCLPENRQAQRHPEDRSPRRLIDGALSVGSGAALLSLPYLEDTVLGPFVPIGDASSFWC